MIQGGAFTTYVCSADQGFNDAFSRWFRGEVAKGGKMSAKSECGAELTATKEADGITGLPEEGWISYIAGVVPGLFASVVSLTEPGLVPFADTRAEVDAFYEAAMAAGGRDNGKPGIRAHYHPNYYGAFVFDPDGNNIEAVCHGAE